MGIRASSNQWDAEYRVFRGIDKRTDRSLITPDFLSNGDNLVLQNGVPECRKGSERWGNLDITSISGTFRNFTTVDVGAEQFILFHVGTAIYAGLKLDAVPDPIQDLGVVPADFVVHDAESEFLDMGFNYGSNGELVRKILVRQAEDCYILEYNSATGLWHGMKPGIDIAGVSFGVIETAGGTNQVIGTYRVRVVARRTTEGVRFQESAPTSMDAFGNDNGYQEVALTSTTNKLQVTITYGGGLDPQVTEFGIHVTKELNFVGGSTFSDNGNDPTLYFEASAAALSGSGMTIDIDTSDLTVPAADLFLHQVIPGHLMSVYAGGVLFFGGVNGAQSRVYKAGISGLFYHSGLYDPTEYYAADEGDGQLLTALEIVGDHLVVFKEKKTGIVANRNLDGAITWRDRRVGVLSRKAIGITSEDEAMVLGHDGILRLFNGVEYSAKKTIGDNAFDVSDKVRTLTKSIDPATISYVWHEERLHLLYGASNARKALVLHPREDFGWTPWSGLEHEYNALIDNDNTWIFIKDGLLYEQTPDGEVYTDFGSEEIHWSITFAALHPKDRINKIWMQSCFVEGAYAAMYSAVFTCDGGQVETAAVGAVPDPTLTEFQYNQWFGMYPDEQVYGQFIELTLAGTGRALFRAVRWKVIERFSNGAGWSLTTELGPYVYMPLYAALEILYLRFDQDSATIKDYSGNRRDHVWSAGTAGTRTHDSALIPGGGESVVLGGLSGFYDEDWDGLDYIGDDGAGGNTASLTYEYVGSFPSLAADRVIMGGADDDNLWMLKVLSTGALRFTLLTTGKAWTFTTAAGIVTAGATLYTIQFVLSNAGDNGQFYAAARTADFATLATTRAAL